jgi:hypothetical protein
MAGQLFNGIPIPLVASAAVTTSSNSGNLKNTSLAFPICEAAAIILDVTALAGVSGVTLDVDIQTSPDNGTTWYTAFEFANVATSTAQRRLDIRDSGIGITEVGFEGDIKTAAAIKNNTVLTQDIRIRWRPNGSGATTTFAVWGIFQPIGTKT